MKQDGEGLFANLQHSLDVISNVQDARLRIFMVNSVIVSSVSAVEEILRQLMGEFLSVLEEGVSSYSRLDSKLRNNNIDKIITEIKSLSKNYATNEALLVTHLSDLSKCISGGEGYRLAKGRLTDNQANFKSGQVTDLAKGIGIADIWTLISNHQAVGEFLGLELGDTCKNALIEEWNEVFTERDTVVHRISSASGWGMDRVRRAIDLFSLVIQRMMQCLVCEADRILEIQAR